MAFCRTAEFLYDALPLKTVRGWLIRGHMERCPRCQARLVGPEEAQGLLVTPGRLGDLEALWRRISVEAARAAAAREPEPARAGLAWRLAASVAVAAVVSLAGFWLLRETGRPGFDAMAVAPADRFEIDYVNVGGAPAQTFVYQPQGTDTVFIWASRTPLTGGV